MTIVIYALVTLLSVAVALTGSMTLALFWIAFVFVFWLVNETLAVRVFLHSYLTHGAFKTKSKLFVSYWLWWSRSGEVRYWEWVINHFCHHALTDTELDSYTPWAYNPLTDMPPLRPPRLRRFWENGKSYSRYTDMIKKNPEFLAGVIATYPEAAAAAARLEELEWAREKYGNTLAALVHNLNYFTIVAASVAVVVGGFWGIVLLAFAPWAMTGLKVVLYLLGGYFINYYGHQAEGPQHQSNLPWWLMVLTLFMMGEGWHRLHHDAPYSARLHVVFDPGWWVIFNLEKLGVVYDVVVAVPDREKGPRHYKPVNRSSPEQEDAEVGHKQDALVA